MKQKIKNYLKKIIFSQIAEYNNRVIDSANNPHEIRFDKGAKMLAPLQIDGGKHITLGQNSLIGKNGWLGAFDQYLDQKFTPEIRIGNKVVIGNYCCITAVDKVTIGDGCLFSEYIYISDHAHGFEPGNIPPASQPLNSKGPVIIGENTFLGFRVTVLPGVTLGKNCVVGSHSVVTRSFPDYSMIAGAPARLLKTYSREKREWIEA